MLLMAGKLDTASEDECSTEEQGMVRASHARARWFYMKRIAFTGKKDTSTAALPAMAARPRKARSKSNTGGWTTRSR